MASKLPNFLIVGAAKCGTSSLHNYLNQHPDIFMPTYTKEGLKVKEPRFLIKDKVKKRLSKGIWDLDVYRSLFDQVTDHKAIGESTVLYLCFYKEAIKNIKKYLGNDVKIIIMLRNPIYRAYSAYSFASRTHQENQEFHQALINNQKRYDEDETLSPMILYKELGLYYRMVKAYIDSFKDVHVILYDDFILETDLEVKKVFDFLGLNSCHKIDTSQIINSGGKKWDSRFAKDFLMGKGFIKSFSRLFFPSQLRVNIKAILIKIFTSKAGDMDDEVKRELLNYYQNDIELLEQLINKDLRKWKKI